MADNIFIECCNDPEDKLLAMNDGDEIYVLIENAVDKESAAIYLNKQSALDLACYLLKEAVNLEH